MNQEQSTQAQVWWRRLLTINTQDPEQHRVGRFLLVFALGLTALSGTGLVFILTAAVQRGPSSSTSTTSGLVTTAVGLVLGLIVYGLVRTGRTALGAWLFLLGFESLVFGSVLWIGIDNAIPLLVLIPIVAAPSLLGPQAGLAFGLGNAILLMASYMAYERGLYTPPNPSHWTVASSQFQIMLACILLISGVYSWLTTRSMSAVREARETAAELQRYQDRLERQVADRTAELTKAQQSLAQRATYLQAAADIGQSASSILDPEQLMEQAVNLIGERFSLYHAALFLADETGQWAEYRAGTGQAGQILLKEKLRVQIGGQSMTGWCIANAQARVSHDARAETVRMDHPALLNTRSEAALPLRARGKVIGALNIHSEQPGQFDQEAIVALQTIADQVAVALDNARLFAENQAALEAERRAYGEISREAWIELLRSGSSAGYRYSDEQVRPIGDVWRPEMRTSLQKDCSVTTSALDGEQAGPAFATPIKVRGQTIGVLDVRKSAGPEWDPEEIALLETLAEQLSLALESARLYQSTQRRAAREQLASTITARMRESLDMERVLKTAADEMFQALELDHIAIRLAPEETVSDEPPKGDEHDHLA